jgi:hypothetical protein
MSDQSHFNRAICFATALSLLAAVMISPIHPAIAAMGSGSSQVDCFHRNLGMPGKATTHHRPVAPVNSRVVQVKALSSNSKLGWMACVVGGCLDLSGPPPLHPERPSSTFTSCLDRTTHPLRC